MTDADDALVRSARATEAAFSQVAGRLSDVRGGLMDLCARLADLDRVLNDQRGNAQVLDALDRSAVSVKTALGDASRAAAPDRLLSAAQTAQASLVEIISCTRVLDAVANLTLVTANSLCLTEFDDYVRSLRLLNGELAQDADRMNQAVETLRRHRRRAAALFAQADGSINRVFGVIAANAEERSATEKLLETSLQATRAQAELIPAVASAETNSLVKAMQYADAVAQQLDHIQTIFARGGDAADVLAAAQLDALTAATKEVAEGVSESLRRIGFAVTKAASVLSADGETLDSPAAKALHLGRNILMAMVDGSAEALSAIEGAARESATLRSLSDEAAARLDSLVQTTDSIHLAAINAALLSRTENGQERAMGVLSIEVQQQAAVCASASAACKLAISQLALSEDLEAFQAVTERARDFRAAITEAMATVEMAEAALAELDQLRKVAVTSMQELDDAAQAAREAVENILDANADLSRIVTTLPRTLPPGAGSLDDLMDIYTMESERVVHRRLFGIPEPAAPTQSAPEVEDDLLVGVFF